MVDELAVIFLASRTCKRRSTAIAKLENLVVTRICFEKKRVRARHCDEMGGYDVAG
jgi:hypothetical protein